MCIYGDGANKFVVGIRLMINGNDNGDNIMVVHCEKLLQTNFELKVEIDNG